jgi:2-polyprenyl-6-methoxyphenol hydroxylase-like FAD-dependent oxidoreductase
MNNVAIVIGASIGGLLAARVLADSFDEVVLVERGELADTPVARPGVPQGNHAHGLLAGGLEALDRLLPGLVDELERLGCPTGDNLRDVAWVFSGRRLAFGDSGVRGMTLGRPLLEATIRRRVLQASNVRLVSGCRVNGLLCTAGRIIGVQVASASGAGEENLTADLVVDASGRHSPLPEWLAAVGFARPRIEEVALETHYTSRIYSRRPHHLNGGIALVIVSDPEQPRGGIALALDDQRWIVSQYALAGDRPPKDHAGFLRFARSLSSPELAAILDAEPLGDSATLRFPSSIRRHYEKMRDFPRGLLVMADALCSFNPTFGQGITVAAKEAVVLRDLCGSVARADLGRAFARKAAPIVDVAWNASVGRTFLYPGVVGRPTLKMRMANAYFPRVIARAHEDAEVATALLEVMHFLAPPERLFAPRFALKVLRPAQPARVAAVSRELMPG